MRMLADVAAVLADRSRAAMCLALLDGRAWTVGELAGAAGIAASTASEHVGVLTDAGFVDTLRQGRHRYVRLAGEEVAELIERLAQHAEPLPATGLRASLRESGWRRAAPATTTWRADSAWRCATACWPRGSSTTGMACRSRPPAGRCWPSCTSTYRPGARC